MIWHRWFMREKSGTPWACPQKCRKMPKTTILVIFSKNYHRIVLNFCIVMETNELYDLAQAVYAGKILHALGMPMKML